MDGQLEIVSMIVEPRTRIPQPKLGEYVKLRAVPKFTSIIVKKKIG
jgi:hypothetical protein